MKTIGLSAAMNRGGQSLIRSSLEARTRSPAAAGAELILICTNTMHKLADTIAAAVESALAPSANRC